MIVTLQTQRVQTLEQVRRVAEGNEPVDFALAERASAYEFIGRTLVQFDYAALGKADKGAVKAYLGKMTGLYEVVGVLHGLQRCAQLLECRREGVPCSDAYLCEAPDDRRSDPLLDVRENSPEIWHDSILPVILPLISRPFDCSSQRCGGLLQSVRRKCQRGPCQFLLLEHVPRVERREHENRCVLPAVSAQCVIVLRGLEE